MTARDAALECVRRQGWFVFRVSVTHDESTCDGGRASCKSVQPLDRHWRKSASSDPAVVAGWDWDEANAYGIDCGRSGLAVADEDPEATWPFNGTRVHSTGRGKHHIYEDLLGLKNRVRITPWGVDVRGDGGFILGPGSWHPHGEYAVLDDSAPAITPVELIEAASPKPRQPQTVEAPEIDPLDAMSRLEGVYRRMREAPEGQRNDLLNKLAGVAAGLWIRLEDANQVGVLGEDSIVHRLSLAAAESGLGPEEIARTLSNGWNYGVEHPVGDETEGGLWDKVFGATPILEHVRTVAHSRALPAPTVLAGLLAELALQIPPHVVLPAVVGSRQPMNLGIALLGASGAAKTSSARVGGEILGLPRPSDWSGGMGSGEGLIDSFYRQKLKDPTDPKSGLRKVLAEVEDRRFMLTIDEAEALMRAKDTSSLPAYLRSGMSGSTLSNTNTKSGGNFRLVPEMTYRLVCSIGVHPDQADVLLSDIGNGFPQRFCWVPCDDPTIPVGWRDRVDAEAVELPGGFTMPEFAPNVDWDSDWHEVAYPHHVTVNVWEHTALRNRDGGDPIEAHAMLVRLRLAVLFSVLHGSERLTELGWELAGLMADASIAVQKQAMRDLGRKALERETISVRRKTEAQAHVEAENMEHAVKAVIRKLRDHPGERLTWRQCRPPWRLRNGLGMDEIREEVLRDHRIHTEKTGNALRFWYEP